MITSRDHFAVSSHSRLGSATFIPIKACEGAADCRPQAPIDEPLRQGDEAGTPIALRACRFDHIRRDIPCGQRVSEVGISEVHQGCERQEVVSRASRARLGPLERINVHHTAAKIDRQHRTGVGNAVTQVGGRTGATLDQQRPWITKTSPATVTASVRTEVTMGGRDRLPPSSVLRMVGDGGQGRRQILSNVESDFRAGGRESSGGKPCRSIASPVHQKIVRGFKIYNR